MNPSLQEQLVEVLLTNDGRLPEVTIARIAYVRGFSRRLQKRMDATGWTGAWNHRYDHLRQLHVFTPDIKEQT